MDKAAARAEISKLVEKWGKYAAEGRLKGLKEEDTKAIFIEPLFTALGWKTQDLDEVSREEQVSRGRADYSFRLSSVTRFFVEAKPADAPLREEEALQAISYAYHKSVPWAILTNFGELMIYNAEWKSKSAEESLFLHFRFDEFISRFDELLYLCRESIETGELDRYAERVHKKPRREPVTKALLDDFTKWRRLLSRNVAEHSRLNKLSKEEIDEAVQKLLNRFVFIRTCEDRQLENERLREAVREWKEMNKRRLMRHLGDIFDEFNEVYDSDLFTPHLAGELHIDEAVLEQVVNELYENEDGIRWNFADVDADVLGSIYEQYLATLMREGGGLRKDENKRKEMGIYYTPTYIVDYIVKNTLGELLSKAKKPADVEKIRILDPACGSGSFLIRAYGLLNEAYKSVNGGDTDMLTESVSRNTYSILTKNLHGVDLDKKAVEITELNLLLRAARKRGRLPLLSDNIRQGNSLISGTEEELEKYFGDRWEEKHPFNWEEKFAEVMKEGGFDVVVGNPPYIRFDNLNEEEREYFFANFKTSVQKCDIFSFFIERGIDKLKDGGMLGFIVSSSWLSQHSFNKLRKLLLEKCLIKQIIKTPKNTFKEAAVDTLVLIIQKAKRGDKPEKNSILSGELTLSGSLSEIKHIPQSTFSKSKDNLFLLDWDEDSEIIESKFITGTVQMNDICRLSFGIMTGDDSKFTYAERQHPEMDKKVIRGGNVKRYAIAWSGEYVWYNPKAMKQYKETARPGEPERFETDKIVIKREGAGTITAALDKNKFYTIGSTFIVNRKDDKFDLRYILALLNSKLLNYWYSKRYKTVTQSINSYQKLPVKIASPFEQQPIIRLVDKMLSLNARLVELGDKKTDERREIEADIRKTDAEIDDLVYRLYSITEEERKIIETSFGEKGQ
ncbi:MAG: N-6 DNA methylase [Candidatus Micrarchaeota archaeon]